MSGLGRVYKRRDSRFWWIRLPLKGGTHRESSRSTRKSDAEELLRLRTEQFRLAPGITRRFTVGELVREYLDDARLRGVKGLDQLERFGQTVVHLFDDELGASLDTSRMRDYQKHLLEAGYAPGTVNLRTRFLRTVLRFAEANGRIPRAPLSPRRLKEAPPRSGFLEHDEFLAILEQLPGWAADVFAFAYYSGWRRNEILHLEWNDVDLEDAVIGLAADQEKTGAARELPIAGGIEEVMRRRQSERVVGFRWVFHRRISAAGPRRVSATGFYQVFRPAAAAVGRPHLYLHDCRRTAVRNLVHAGTPERVAMQYTGHRSRSVFDRYHIVGRRELSEASLRLWKYLEGRGG